MNYRADLHLHTQYSDGLYTPEELIDRAKKANLEVIALTDHDTIEGVEKVRVLGEKENIKVIAGSEISAYDGDVKIHTLGYGIDITNKDFLQFTKYLLDCSVKRTEDIVYKLNKAGYKITMEEVDKERFSKNTPMHVMHVAFACAKKGYAKNENAMFSNMLSYGKVAFSNICRPTPEEGIEGILLGGGIPVIAHPGRIDRDGAWILALIKRLIPFGLQGIECVYSGHTISQTAYYKGLAKELNLIITGGSDSHCDSYGGKVGTPVFFIDDVLAKKFKI